MNIENTGFASFAMFNAIKLHFTTDSYDYIKYHGKTNVTKNNFSTRKDKYSFYKLSRRFSLDELKNFYVANFLAQDVNWVGDIMGPEGEENYKKWQKVTQSLSYVFKNDIEYLTEIDGVFKANGGEYPKFLVEVMRGKVSLETLVIMDDLSNFIPKWNKTITDDIVWPSIRRKCIKYKPFIQYDKKNFENIIKSIINKKE
jgi:hypothetical protein